MNRFQLALSACLPVFAMLGATPGAAKPAAGAEASMRALYASRPFDVARKSLAADYDRMVSEITTLTEIPAPPFKEAKRAAAYLEMLRAAGLQDVEMDAEGNVMGLRKGTGGGPLLVVAAHLDTVFPEGTPIKVRREGDYLHAPGIGDDTSSLPVLLAFIRALDKAGIRTRSDILFMGDVGEEGPGDLRGMRHLFTKGKYKGRIAQFISIEPGRDRVTNGGVGSKRYKVTFTGPGGHSYGAFGLVSPAYAMGDAIVEFGKMKVPAHPRTTFNVGVVEGGTSVNSIPFETAMTVDMRSESKDELAKADAYLHSILPGAVDRENAARSTARGKISYEAKLIGDRPVGHTADDNALVRTAYAAIAVGGGKPELESSSTDANMPMSLGIPAITIGSGFASERSHSPGERLKLDREDTLRYMTMSLATVIGAAGIAK
ncbi:M20/M25/M40 family metallo-hydrolase [uncultured Sphingomonas sp.]|uniref:M20/M25/M40 family metallo-hydrolase n=1 Tax=uncultured Sphingomonas sp. TaxID=158754 RepID=UPI00263014BC|nr:M20/M25/M40 family metallo-hydrolase [uncultured Sphingomonas sp.]